MGFGGSAQAMITILKNNNRRHQRKAFENRREYAGYGLEQEKPSRLKSIKATKEQLTAIKEKLSNDRKKLFWKRVIVAVVFPTAVVLAFYFLMNI